MFGDIQATRRNLPHWTRADSATTYWVTFRLADSIPQEKLRAFAAERDVWMTEHLEPWDADTRTAYRERFPARMETWLDAGYGSRALAREDVRDVVAECLTRFEGERLLLPAAVVMPTHVHALIAPLGGQALSSLLRGIKGASARGANRVLGHSGVFWLDESYDRIVRDESECAAFVRYIADNPVRAGLRADEYWLRLPKEE